MLAEPRVRRLPRRTNSVHMLMRPTAAYAAQPTSPASRSVDPPAAQQGPAWPDEVCRPLSPMPLRASCTGLIISDIAPPLCAMGYRPQQLGPVSCAPIAAAAAASMAQAHAAGGTPEARSLGQRRFSSIVASQYGAWQQQAGAGEGAGSHEVLSSAARCHSSVAVSTVSSGAQVPLKRCGTDEIHEGFTNSNRTALPSTPSISAGGAMARILNITLATVGPKGSRQACAFSLTPNTTFSQLQCAPSDTSLWNSSLSRMPPGMDSKLLLLRPASTFSSGAAEHAAAIVQAAGTLPPLAPGQTPEAHVESEAALVTALHAELHGEQVTGADSLADSGTVAGGGAAAAAAGGRVRCVNALNDASSNTSPADAHLLGSLDLRPKVYGARPGSADSETAVLRRQAFDGECGSTVPSGTVPDGRTSTRVSGEVTQSSLSPSAAFGALHLLAHSPSICGTAPSPFSAAAIHAVYSEPAEAGAAIVGPAADGAGCGLPPADCAGMEAGRLVSVLPQLSGGAAAGAAGAQTPEAMVMTLTFGEGCQPLGALLGSSGQPLEFQERLFGGGSSTAAAEEQSAVAYEQAPGTKGAVAEAAARGDALRAAGLGCPVVAPGLRLPATGAAPESQAQSETDVAEPESEWHEVSLTSFLHPQLRCQVVLVAQNDVSERIWAERQLVRVVEAEHTLLENIFPHHVIEHIATTAAKGAGPSSERNTPDLAFMTSRLSAAATAAIHVDAATLGPQAHAQPDRLPAIRGSTFLHLATSHRAITVLFCDIQGFTPMCNEVRPVVVMAFLNDLFTRLDAMLDTYGIYKVETIGDCYVAAGGLMKVDEETGAVTVRSRDVDPQHAHQTVQFAKALLRAAAAVRLPIRGQPVRLRVGIHSGPAMSGVVGTRMPRFCLFGDTMNTASRMESTGVPGAIHVSQATRDLVPGEDWEPTGGVEVKGKGMMNTFLLRPPLS